MRKAFLGLLCGGPGYGEKHERSVFGPALEHVGANVSQKVPIQSKSVSGKSPFNRQRVRRGGGRGNILMTILRERFRMDREWLKIPKFGQPFKQWALGQERKKKNRRLGQKSEVKHENNSSF